MRLLVICVLLSPLFAASARGEMLTVLSYDMPNGYGQATGGSYNYWDLKYNGSGNTMTDMAPLSGGVGDLTDGVISSDFWYNVENDAGTGPYVAWVAIDPTITFRFDGVSSYETIRVHFDDSNVGVRAPESILVADGLGHSELFAISNPGSGTLRWVDLDVSGIGLAGDTVGLTLNRGGAVIFTDEIQFYGTSAVPEPSTFAMLTIGGCSLGALRFGRRKSD